MKDHFHREIIAIKYAFPEDRKKLYGPMFAFKPRSPLGSSLLKQHISVIHNTTMRVTDHIVALGEVLKNLLHPDNFQHPTPTNAKEVPRYLYSAALREHLETLLPSNLGTPQTQVPRLRSARKKVLHQDKAP